MTGVSQEAPVFCLPGQNFLYACYNSDMELFPYTIRPIQPANDAEKIAELVKTSFRPWLDHENLEYLDQLKKAGMDAGSNPLWTNLVGFPYPMAGVVCTDAQDRILGVINTNPFFLGGKQCCLVTNVCVAPDHRGRGIASHMLDETERIQRREHISGLYLQARQSTPGVIGFYKKHGFTVTDYRENWIWPKAARSHPEGPVKLRMEIVPGTDKEIFRKRFSVRYPDSVRWNMNPCYDLFRTGKTADLVRRLSSRVNLFRRVVDKDGKVMIWGAFQKQSEKSDLLWLVPGDGTEDEELVEALRLFCARYRGGKPLKLDVPADDSGHIYRSAGFVFQQTLVWMWKRL